MIPDHPASVVDVTTADVHKAGRLAARLTRGADGVTFDYVAGYDAHPSLRRFRSASAPCRGPAVLCRGSSPGCCPRVAGSVPCAAVKTSVDDELSLLLAVGHDTVGDVQVVPTGTAARPAAARVQLAVPTGVRYRDLLAELDLRPDRTALPGVHAKNFSVLQQPDGEWRVSPAYDVPTSQPYGDTTYAMPVNGRRTDAGARDVLALGWCG